MINAHDNDKREEFSEVAAGEEEKCRTLWLAVIMQAVMDSRGKHVTDLEKERARLWLGGEGIFRQRLATVCDLANVDFEKTRQRCAYLLSVPHEPVDFRAMKRDKEENRTIRNRRRYIKRVKKNAAKRTARRLLMKNANDNMPQPANDNDATAAGKISTETKGENDE